MYFKLFTFLEDLCLFPQFPYLYDLQDMDKNKGLAVPGAGVIFFSLVGKKALSTNPSIWLKRFVIFSQTVILGKVFLCKNESVWFTVLFLFILFLLESMGSGVT